MLTLLTLFKFTGVNAIAYYTPTIYESSLGFPAVEAGALAAASQACIILGGIICSFTVDRVREPIGERLLLISAVGVAVITPLDGCCVACQCQAHLLTLRSLRLVW